MQTTATLPARSRRWWPVAAVFAAVTTLQVLVAVASIDLLSSARAYVTGESLYSKGQKDAQIHLMDYADFQRETDYAAFVNALSVPLGDRVAREALQKLQPDLAAARRGFLQGGNDEGDIDGLIRLFLWFHDVPFMAEAIGTWTEGDRVIEQMRTLVEQAHERVAAGDLDALAVHEMRAQAPLLNRQLTELERTFSGQLGAASRKIKVLLLAMNVGLALLLSALGLAFVRQSLRARAAAEAEVRTSAARLSRIVSSVADGVITIDADGRIVLFNRAAEHMFRAAATEVVGQPLAQFVPLRLREAHHEMLRRFAQGRAEARVLGGLHDLTGLRADGSEFPMEASLSKLDTDQGLLVTVVLRDVSEQRAAHAERQARAALEASNVAKTQFLSRMSHELRTPLNAVLGFSQLLRVDRTHVLDPAQLARVQHIEHAGAHLLALVNDVLDLSRVESGQIRLSLQPVEVQRVMNEAMAFVSPLAVGAGVDVRLASSPHDPLHGGTAAPAWVMADPVRLRQVLVNLLSNAVKYNRRGGSVTLSLQGRGANGRICVADSGIGMTEEQLARLYEPFNRLGAERTRVEGTGIGLVLSRHLVQLMHGNLQIESRVGHGTHATIELRRAEMPAEEIEHAPYVPSQHGALEGSLSVLYAEDNEVNVELVRQVIALRPAVSLRVANNGATALAMARSDPPDLMLVDMHLGDMTGLELAQALHRDPSTAAIPLVALSADALPEQISNALDRGFHGYLTKPLSFKDLLRVIDRAVQ